MVTNSNEYQRIYRLQSSVKYRYPSRMKARRKEIVLEINHLKMKSCMDCGWFPSIPEQMDFDHLGDKTKDVSYMANHGWSLESILLEISKCELVCSNCHRLRTYIRRQVG